MVALLKIPYLYIKNEKGENRVPGSDERENLRDKHEALIEFLIDLKCFEQVTLTQQDSSPKRDDILEEVYRASELNL
jgi:hypothetical protein